MGWIIAIFKIRKIWLDLVVFYGISTLMGYLIPNSVYTYFTNDLQTNSLQVTFLNEPKLICLNTVE